MRELPEKFLEDTSLAMADGNNERGEQQLQRVKPLPSAFIVLLLGVYLLLGYLAQLSEHAMPRVADEASVAQNDSSTFSEETAYRYLLQIIGNKPRVAGTAYHLEKTRDLKSLVDDIAAKAKVPVHTDLQITNGETVWINSGDFLGNISNIVVLLEGESGIHSNGTPGTTILVNCHYDSVPEAIGAGDDGVFCAVMAETLSRMSRRTKKFRHNIVFLFNGAEEFGLLGSAAFIQHPWSKGVTTVINLDSPGINGKPSIVKVTDSRLMAAYGRSVNRPSAQSVIEFILSIGVIPSDDDFSLFTYEDIDGIDMAFTKYVGIYHSRLDEPSLLLPGVLQNAGNMLLALLTEVAESAEFDYKRDDNTEDTVLVYYDYLNWFLISYSPSTALVIDLLVVTFALTSVLFYVYHVRFTKGQSILELLHCAFGRILSMVAGMLVTAILVRTMVATTAQKRYLTEPWIVVPLFWMPYIIPAVGVSQLYDIWILRRNGGNRSTRALQAAAATRLLLATALLALVIICNLDFVTIRYIISVPLLLMSAMSIVVTTIMGRNTLKGWQHLILELLLSIPTLMFVFALVLRVNALILPITEHISTATPDYYAAVINVGLATIASAVESGIELLFSRKRLWMVLLALGVACVTIMFIPFSPYDDAKLSVQS